jgi:peptide/nickel transport system ATP-binding protein
VSLLDVDDLRVGFAGDGGVVARAVDGVSFSVPAGGALGIVGESGCGKSVSALAIMGLLREVRAAQVSGSVRFDGHELIGAPPDELRSLRGDRIAMVFQDPLSSLHPLRRVGDQVGEAITAHRGGRFGDAVRARVTELFELVGIPEAARRLQSYPHELSGGMRQRVMIAMALANDPELLIADEPTTALDVTVQAQILELLARLRAELGMALVLITHDAGVVAQVVDEVCVMYAGRIVERAAATTLFAAPQHPYTWGLLGAIPRLDRPRGMDLVPIEGRPPSPTARPPGCAFAPRCAYARPSHSVLDPALEPLAEAPEHGVACLLGQETRTALWAALSDGATPAAARLAARVDELPEPEASS